VGATRKKDKKVRDDRKRGGNAVTRQVSKSAATAAATGDGDDDVEDYCNPNGSDGASLEGRLLVMKLGKHNYYGRVWGTSNGYTTVEFKSCSGRVHHTETLSLEKLTPLLREFFGTRPNDDGKWRAYIDLGEGQICTKYCYDTEGEAAHARDKMCADNKSRLSDDTKMNYVHKKVI